MTKYAVPAGFYPVHAFWPWVSVAGSALHCAHCGAEGRAPSPREPGPYDVAVEAWLRRHKACPSSSGVAA